MAYYVPMDHPARFSDPILDVLRKRLGSELEPSAVLLDPFAGTGRIHELGYESVGVEIEPEWASLHDRTICGDSTHLATLLPEHHFDAVVTSPAYGNRMADQYAGDSRGSKRFTYRIALGRPLAPENLAGLQWGQDYRDLHEQVWNQCLAVLKPGGLLFVNVSNHIRNGTEQPVVEWHINCLIGLGCFIDSVDKVTTRRMRFGSNRHARIEGERLVIARCP